MAAHGSGSDALLAMFWCSCSSDVLHTTNTGRMSGIEACGFLYGICTTVVVGRVIHPPMKKQEGARRRPQGLAIQRGSADVGRVVRPVDRNLDRGHVRLRRSDCADNRRLDH